MSVKLGMYEFFGRVIPGFFYLVSIVQMGELFDLYTLDMQVFSQIQLVTGLALGVIAYLLGTAFNPVSMRWIRLFKPRDTLETALTIFRKRNPEWEIYFKEKDWHVLLAYLRRQNLELVEDVIERPNAFYIMLRNVSLSLIFLAIIQIFYFLTLGNLTHIWLIITFVVISILLGREAKMFQVMFFSLIFETIISYQINLNELVEKPKKIKSPKKQDAI